MELHTCRCLHAKELGQRRRGHHEERRVAFLDSGSRKIDPFDSSVGE